jgi:hypothetical protein
MRNVYFFIVHHFYRVIYLLSRRNQRNSRAFRRLLAGRSARVGRRWYTSIPVFTWYVQLRGASPLYHGFRARRHGVKYVRSHCRRLRFSRRISPGASWYDPLAIDSPFTDTTPDSAIKRAQRILGAQLSRRRTTSRRLARPRIGVRPRKCWRAARRFGS